MAIPRMSDAGMEEGSHGSCGPPDKLSEDGIMPGLSGGKRGLLFEELPLVMLEYLKAEGIEMVRCPRAYMPPVPISVCCWCQYLIGAKTPLCDPPIVMCGCRGHAMEAKTIAALHSCIFCGKPATIKRNVVATGKEIWFCSTGCIDKEIIRSTEMGRTS